VTLSLGTIEVRRSRIRNLDERFVSQVLPLFRRQSREVRELLPELYLHGLASGDCELALRGLLGAGAPLSVSSLQRLKEKWAMEYEQWQATPIEESQLAYLWADGIYVKAGLGKEKTTLLVVIGAMQDGSKRVWAMEVGYRESNDSWGRCGNSSREGSRRCGSWWEMVIEDYGRPWEKCSIRPTNSCAGCAP
jgi:putative transposase